MKTQTRHTRQARNPTKAQPPARWFYHPDWDLEHQVEFAVNSLGVVVHLLAGEKYLSLDERTIEAAASVVLLAQEVLDALDLSGAAMTGIIRLHPAPAGEEG